VSQFAACSPGGEKAPAQPGLVADSGAADAARGDVDPSAGFDASGLDGSIDRPPTTTDPVSCAEAAARKSYVGCDYWPTVVANNVWSIFDYAVVVANAGDEEASVTVTGPGGVDKTVKVAPNALTKIYLPWVRELKGRDLVECAPAALEASVKVAKGAYHLVSTKPVTVYQFNALQYRGTGGPPGKSWAECPPPGYCRAGKLECFSFTNDASLLLPSTAMTGNYRVTAIGGWTDPTTGEGITGSYFAITATQDGTEVKVTMSKTGLVLAGTGIAATAAGEVLDLKLGAGDVVELACAPNTKCDPSGSLVQANHPVQVITGVPCTNVPSSLPTCDHIEETVFPAETLGKHYFATVPTGPKGNIVGHILRFYGNVDGTRLTYAPTTPPGAPTTLDAGQVVEVPWNADLEITGDAAFAIGSFMIGSSNLDPYTPPPDQKGDPSQSMVVAVEQYRTKYVFLTPDDYDLAYLDMVVPTGAKVMLDGKLAVAVWDKTITKGFRAVRVRLAGDEQGAHVLTADQPFGLQVIGYGSYTSYYYPGGLNLQPIAPPPIK
ncbi:MAG: IgGFc-binding protein, partial [Polyangiales bacterium]